MALDEVRTSHDLATLLEDAARGLRMLPPFELLGTQRSAARNDAKLENGVEDDQGFPQGKLALLAQQLPELERPDAETELFSLTVEKIRQLAPLLDVRVPSKATKKEYVQMLLTQLFDAPAGQDVIRNFHKRTGRSKPLTGSQGTRRTRGGKGRVGVGGKPIRLTDEAATLP